MRGPAQYPSRNNVMVSPATSVETPKCSDIDWKQPLGELEAKVAFTTSRIALMVMTTRRPRDQLRGFSTSSGVKSTKPSWLRYGVSFGRSLERYGLLFACERMRTIADITRSPSSSPSGVERTNRAHVITVGAMKESETFLINFPSMLFPFLIVSPNFSGVCTSPRFISARK